MKKQKNILGISILLLFLFFTNHVFAQSLIESTIEISKPDSIKLLEEIDKNLNQGKNFISKLNEQFIEIDKLISSKEIEISQEDIIGIEKIRSTINDFTNNRQIPFVYPITFNSFWNRYTLAGVPLPKIGFLTAGIEIARRITPSSRIPIVLFPETYVNESIVITPSSSPIILIGDGGTLDGGRIICLNLNKFSSISGFTIIDNSSALLGGGVSILDANVLFMLNTINNNSASVMGGGLYSTADNNTPMIIGNTISGNDAPKGGGIAFKKDDNSISILNNVDNNTSTTCGGGVYFHETGSCNFLFNFISDNNTEGNGGGIALESAKLTKIGMNEIINNESSENGGGIWCSGQSWLPSLIVWNTISGNTAGEEGGGISLENDGWAIVILNEIINNHFVNGTSQTKGGGISINGCYVIDTLGVPAPIFITGNNIKNNTADIGGALWVSDCWSIVYANEMYNNVGNDYGGGIYIETDDNIKWNKIKGNQSPYGGGIYIKGAYDPTIHDNDIYLNTADYGGAIYCTDGTAAEIYENEIFENSSTHNGGAIFITGDDTNPEIGPSNMFLRNHSFYGGAIYFEDLCDPNISDNLFFKNLAQIGGAIYCNSSFAEIVDNEFYWNQSCHGGGAIYVHPGMTPLIQGNQFQWNIAGSNIVPRNLDLAGYSLDRILANGGAIFTEGSGANPFILQNYFKWNVATNGGAIAIEDGSAPLLNNNTFTENFADYDTTGAGIGGAIYISNSNPNIDADSLIWNIARHGGGIAYDSGAQPIITNCYFKWNIADYDSAGTGIGGAMYVTGSNTNPTIGIPGSGNIFEENIAENGGAIAGDNNCHPVIQTNTFTSNHTDFDNNGSGNGGGIYFKGGGTGADIGGNAVCGEGNLFELNTAGSPDYPGLGNGGAIATENGAYLNLSGNTFDNHNACTNSGAAIYLSGNGTNALIGGINDDEIINFPFTNNQFGNIIQNNNRALKIFLTLPIILWPTEEEPDTLVLDLDTPPEKPDTTRIPIEEEYDISYSNSVVVDTYYLPNLYSYVTDCAGGLIIVDITDPINPVVIDSFPTNSFSCDVDVRDNYLFWADGDSDLRIFDTSPLADSLLPIELEPLVLDEIALFDVAVDNSYIYALGDNNTIYIIKQDEGEEFTEGFESVIFPPEGWELIQTHPTTTWTLYGDYVYEGTNAAGVWWAYGHQDEWLITPEFEVGETSMLEFWSYAFQGSIYGDHYYTRVSTDGGATWSPEDILLDMSALTGGWNYYTTPYFLDLSTYAGQMIKLAWHAEDPPDNNGMWYQWLIDGISVMIEGRVLTFKAGDLIHEDHSNKTLTSVVNHSVNNRDKTIDIGLASDGTSVLPPVVTTDNGDFPGKYNLYRDDASGGSYKDEDGFSIVGYYSPDNPELETIISIFTANGLIYTNIEEEGLSNFVIFEPVEEDEVNLEQIGAYLFDGFIQDIFVLDSLAYIIYEYEEEDSTFSALKVLNISNPANIFQMTDVPPYIIEDVYISVYAQNEYCYLTSNMGISKIGISDRSYVFFETNAAGLDIEVLGNNAYLAEGYVGFSVYNMVTGGLMSNIENTVVLDTMTAEWLEIVPYPPDSLWTFEIPELPDTVIIDGRSLYFYKNVSNSLKSLTEKIDLNSLNSNKFFRDENDSLITINGGFLAVVDSAEVTVLGNLIGGENAVDANIATEYGGGIYVNNAGQNVIIGEVNTDEQKNFILGNIAQWGGGISVVTHTNTALISNNIIGGLTDIEGNIAGLTGAGIFSSNSNLEVDHNIIQNNYVGIDGIPNNSELGFGGGLALLSSNSKIHHNWIIDNFSYGSAGGIGIGLNAGKTKIYNNTITENNGIKSINSDGIGDGLLIQAINDSCIIKNNIFDHFGSYETYAIYADSNLIFNPTLILIENNDVWNSTGKKYGGLLSDQTGINGNISENPLFVDPAQNNYNLDYNSPANGMGWNPEQGNTTVSSNVYSVPGDFTTITDAMNAAFYGDKIRVFPEYDAYDETFPIDVKDGVILTSTAFDEPLNLNIIEQTVVEGDGSNDVFQMQSAETRTVISGFTIKNGNSGIYLKDSKGLVFANLLFENNTGITMEFEEASSQFTDKIYIDHNTVINGTQITYGSGFRQDFTFPQKLQYGPIFTYNISIPSIETNIDDFPFDTPLFIAFEMNDFWPDGLSGYYDYIVGVAENNIEQDPCFVDESEDDFHLSAGSPCLLTGTGNYTSLIGALYEQLEADFTASPTSGPAPLTVTFSNSSINSLPSEPIEYLWYFGTGDSSIVENPEYTYTDTGSYSVSLTIKDRYALNTETKVNYITVSSVVPAAPENVNIYINSDSVYIQWDAVSGATSYKVYYSNNPNSGFIEDTSGIFDGTTWSAPIYDEKRFYYVTTVSDDGKILDAKNDVLPKN